MEGCFPNFTGTYTTMTAFYAAFDAWAVTATPDVLAILESDADIRRDGDRLRRPQPRQRRRRSPRRLMLRSSDDDASASSAGPPRVRLLRLLRRR